MSIQIANCPALTELHGISEACFAAVWRLTNVVTGSSTLSMTTTPIMSTGVCRLHVLTNWERTRAEIAILPRTPLGDIWKTSNRLSRSYNASIHWTDRRQLLVNDAIDLEWHMIHRRRRRRSVTIDVQSTILYTANAFSYA